MGVECWGYSILIGSCKTVQFIQNNTMNYSHMVWKRCILDAFFGDWIMIEWHLKLKASTWTQDALEITFAEGLRQSVITLNEDINANVFSLRIFNYIICEVVLKIHWNIKAWGFFFLFRTCNVKKKKITDSSFVSCSPDLMTNTPWIIALNYIWKFLFHISLWVFLWRWFFFTLSLLLLPIVLYYGKYS